MAKMRSLALEIAGVSVPEAASTIILRNHVIYEALKLKIVNYHALASIISKEVEELTGKKASINTIVVAIKRFSDNLPKEKVTRAGTILRDAKIDLAGGIVDVTVTAKGVSTSELLESVLKLVPKLAGNLNIFQLPNSVKLLAEQQDAEVVRKELSQRYSVMITDDVAKISIRISPTAEKVPGIASFITELLFRNGVNILDAFLGYEDIVMIVKDKFGPKAFQLLSE